MKKIMLHSFLVISGALFAQKKLAVLDVHTENLNVSPDQMGGIVRIEVDKLGKYEVMDKFDLDYVAKQNNISLAECYGKTCLVEKGRVLKANLMLGGDVSSYGEIITVNLKLIDVDSSSQLKSYIREFKAPSSQLKAILELSVREMFDMEVNKEILSQLTSKPLFDDAFTEPYADRLKLNGPRMGFTVFTGSAAKTIQDKKSNGGFDASPVMFQFGYQFETQYINEGNYQGLFEFVPAITGMDQGMVIPSFTIMNGLRNNKNGWEFALGPTFHLSRTGKGYYDKNGNWVRLVEGVAAPENVTTERKLDSQGIYVDIIPGFVVAVGKTFKSGKLNIPVNAYLIPSKTGMRFGASFGFNGRKK
jgi:hypothetical protein